MADPTATEIGFEQGMAFIEIKYPRATDDPARIFRTMARLIDAFHQIDKDLAHALGTHAEPALLLERVEASSIRAWLRTILGEVDDDALKNLDWKPLVGQYLVRGKHALLRWAEDKPRIESRAEVLGLQRELLALAPGEVTHALLPSPIPPAQLLADVKLLADATAELRDGDEVRYVSENADTRVETNLSLSSDEVERLLTEDVVTSEVRMVLLIKKPDYLGRSRWEFRLEDRTVEASVTDVQWLEQFRAGSVLLRPGDALDAQVRSELYRGFEGQAVGTRYTVLRVYGVVHAIADVQSEIDFGS